MSHDWRDPFDTLGVRRNARTQEIEVAWSRHVAANGGEPNRVPADIWRAYECLRVECNAALLREILNHHETKRSVHIKPSEYALYERFCLPFGIRLAQAKNAADVYFVRLPGDDPPDATLEDVIADVIRSQSAVPLARPVARGLRASAAALVVLGTVYMGALALQHGLANWRDWRAEEHRRLRGELEAELPRLRTLASALDAKLRGTFGVSVEEARAGIRAPRSLDAALLRHKTAREAWAELQSAWVDERWTADHAAALKRADIPFGELKSRLQAVQRRLAELEAQESNFRHVLEIVQATAVELARNAADARRKEQP